MNKTFPLQHWQSTLLEWWQDHGRVLPWREKDGSTAVHTTNPRQKSDVQLRERAFQDYMTHHLRRDPYRVVVAELMLQQTQVDRVQPKYIAWMKKWPHISDLAEAELAEVLIFWQGLGYNRRARFLWLLAKEVAHQRSGDWPTTEAELLQLPGIGKYTARAVMSFAFGQQVAVVDTNVKRVLRRVLDGREAASLPIPSEKAWFALADSVVPAFQADPWNQLIMDFGAMVCTAKAPKCETCPIQHICLAQQLAVQAGFSTYREYLQANPIVAKSTRKTIKFVDTDRYFRGRIMDILRQGSIERQQLWEKLHVEHGLLEENRFKILLAALQDEGLIHTQNTTIKLG